VRRDGERVRHLPAGDLALLGAITFYSVVLWLHLSAVVIAFGVTFAYPVIVPAARRSDRRNLPFLHRTQVVVGRAVITPAATIVLLAGIYLVARHPAFGFGDWWVSFGFAAIIVILGLNGAYFTPRERRLAKLAERDVGASGSEAAALSPEYESLARRVLTVEVLTSLLVLATMFVMVVGSTGAA
jgi:hypothetical protein